MQDDYDSRITEAKQFLKFCNDADSNNRAEALEDILFCSGDQWPVELQNSRSLESRPCLTINKLDAYCRQITNQQRQQRPRIKVHGMNNESDAKVAEILQGICRHIEVNSNADDAYDHAFDFAVRMGWGYWRVETDYVSEKSFDQEIYIRRINNPFTVYFDPNSILPNGSDAEKVLITEVIRKEVFRKMYPDADDGSGFHQRGTGDTDSEWLMKEDIRIAEYFWTERQSEDLVLLSDGSHVFASELPKKALLEQAGIYEVSRRKSFKKVIKWAKMSGMEILEEGIWPGKYIPIVRVTGQQLIVHNKKKYFGLARQAKDPQKMYNFWQTALTESVALAPKAKWLLAEGQDEGHENEWAQANIKAMPVLRYKQTDIEGRPAPAPQRLQPEPPPAGVMAAAQSLSADLMAVIGIYDPAQLPQGNISGKALQGQQQSVDMTNYHYYDNLTQGIAHTGKIILDLVPHIYDTERVMRIIGEDGKPELVTLNQRGVDEMGVEKILNDVTVGEYDVVMETGPGYNSKRQESVDAMLGMLQADPTLMQTAGDLIFRNMDFPGAEIIADRMAAANPMAQIDDKSPIPPQVQMQLKMSQAQVQQMQQQIQQLQMAIKQRQDIEQVKQDNETKRELLRQTSKAHNTETMAEVKVHDQNTRAITSQNKVEIEAIMELLLHHMDTARLEKEIAARNAEQTAYGQAAIADIHQGANPLASR
ncbi:phage P22 like portal protein [Caudoviricetes sp.]|nr:phage P22 like portal protein [Caudoviricetes sp.]